MREAASWIAPSARTTRPEGSPSAADPPTRPLVTRSARDAGESARRAEPRSIGSASARDPLAREVKLLGALLGLVIVEQEGAELFELVEDLGECIRGRKDRPRETRAGAQCARTIVATSPGARGLHSVLPALNGRGEAPCSNTAEPRAVERRARRTESAPRPARAARWLTRTRWSTRAAVRSCRSSRRTHRSPAQEVLVAQRRCIGS